MKRIEYIDAMRGFTMALVVMCHVCTFLLSGNERTFSFNSMMGEFRMPLFFFVSGFLLYKSHYVWDISGVFSFLQKKVFVQIISPFLFFCINGYLTGGDFFIEGLFDSNKRGYWFTWTLFEFFLLYIVFHIIIDMMRIKGYIKDVCLLLFAGIIYWVSIFQNRLPFDSQWINFIGLSKWLYFFYFMLGNRIRKHFALFEQYLDRTYVLLTAIIVFTMFNIYHGRFPLFGPFTALSGIVIVFAYFRKHAYTFSSQTKVGKLFLYIGRRTLDIYLLHYFIVFSNINQYLRNMLIYKDMDPFSELLFSFIISIPIIAFCLFISSVLRLSPLLAHYLFGERVR